MSVFANPLVAAIASPVVAAVKRLCQPADGNRDAEQSTQSEAQKEGDSKGGSDSKAASQAAGLTVASLLNRYAPQFVKQHTSQAVPQVQSTLAKLALCRTRALGGHVFRCGACQSETPIYNSCGDRHCP